MGVEGGLGIPLGGFGVRVGGGHTPRFSPLPSIIEYIEGLLEKDRRDNRNIGAHGASDILGRVPGGGPITLLTHCNTGTLATAGYGTALGTGGTRGALGGYGTALGTGSTGGLSVPRFPPGVVRGSLSRGEVSLSQGP